jgi:hypothetical protein
VTLRSNRKNTSVTVFWPAFLLSIGALSVLFFILIVLMSPSKQNTENHVSLLPSAHPTRSYLPPGKQTYTINSAQHPAITSLTLDPLAIERNDTQRLTALIEETSPITEAYVVIFTDHERSSHTLTRTDSGFTTTWHVQDTVNTRYIIKIVAKSQNETSETIITPRSNGPIPISDLQ